jgi:hypothetical protein
MKTPIDPEKFIKTWKRQQEAARKRAAKRMRIALLALNGKPNS